jgi:hypothetical protein
VLLYLPAPVACTIDQGGSPGGHGLAAELVLLAASASTAASPPRPPQCQIHPPCPNNTWRPLYASTTCSTSSSHALQVRPGHAFGLARSIPACTRRPRPPPPLHPHQGLWHDGKHMSACLQARAHCSVAHLKPQTSSLACGSAGGVAVAAKAGFAQQHCRNRTFRSTPPHTTGIDKIAIRALTPSRRATLVCVSSGQRFVVARTDKARQTPQAKPTLRDEHAAAATVQYFLFHTTTNRPHQPNSNTSSYTKP